MFKYEIKWCSDSCRKSFNSLICLHLSSDVVKEALNITQLLASRFSAHHIRMVGTPQIHPFFTGNTHTKKKKKKKRRRERKKKAYTKFLLLLLLAWAFLVVILNFLYNWNRVKLHSYDEAFFTREGESIIFIYLVFPKF